MARVAKLEAGEDMVFQASNRTFHRSFSQDYEITVSTRALYLPGPCTYADDKLFDREVLRKVLDACAKQGVADCEDRTSRAASQKA